MSITLVVADDHKIMRDGLRFLLEREADMEVVAECGTGRESARLAADLRPDVAVLDVAMPDMDGIDAATEIRLTAPSVKIIGLSMYAEKRFVVRMLRAGASAYLLKEGAFNELARAIRLVTANEVYVSNGLLSTVLDDVIRGLPQARPSKPVLTDREHEVLGLLAEGLSTKAVAARLGITVQTVSTHRVHAMNKLGLYSTADLVRYAIQEGVVAL